MVRPTTFQTGVQESEPEPIELSEEMTVLLDAVRVRFPEPGYEVTYDHNTVWIKSAGGMRTVGLNLWRLRTHTMDEMFDRAEAKLSASPVAPKGD